MIHRLNLILKKSRYNYNFKKGYIKYLSSLDFKEFEELFSHYVEVIAIALKKYDTEKIKLLSKDWFKYKSLIRKYNTVFSIFFQANYDFTLDIIHRLEVRNNIKEEIIKNMQLLLNISYNNIFSQDFKDKQNLIKLSICLSDWLYITHKLDSLNKQLEDF
mgnify:CR=1 FL=1